MNSYGLQESDQTAASFMLSSPDNTVHMNTAAGSESHGFWLKFPHYPVGYSLIPEYCPANI